MSAGLIGFSQPGEADQPSPSIWGDCPKTLLNDKGLGRYVHEDFLGTYAITTPDATQPIGTGAFTFVGDSDTSITSVADCPSGIVDMETDTTDEDQGYLVSQAFAKIVRNSGKKVWFEARVAPGDVDDDCGTFVGLTEEDGMVADFIEADPTNYLATLDAATAIGYFQGKTTVGDQYDLMNKKTSGTAVRLLADVTNADAIPSASQASLIDGVGATGAGFHKLGIKFDGRETLHYYVDGYRVATDDVDSTVDQSNYLGAIVGIKTGDGAAEKIFIDWIRFAYQERS